MSGLDMTSGSYVVVVVTSAHANPGGGSAARNGPTIGTTSRERAITNGAPVRLAKTLHGAGELRGGHTSSDDGDCVCTGEGHSVDTACEVSVGLVHGSFSEEDEGMPEVVGEREELSGGVTELESEREWARRKRASNA
jgi:hypothetical protein